MIKILKPVSKVFRRGKLQFEEFEIVRPIMRSVSGSETEDFEEGVDIPGDRVVFRIKGNPWYWGINSSQWKVQVYDPYSGRYLQQNLYRVDKRGRDWDLFVELNAVPEIPEGLDPDRVTLGGVPVTIGGVPARIGG